MEFPAVVIATSGTSTHAFRSAIRAAPISCTKRGRGERKEERVGRRRKRLFLLHSFLLPSCPPAVPAVKTKPYQTPRKPFDSGTGSGKSIIHDMSTIILSFLKSILTSAIIAGAKKFLFSKLPDWTNAESVRTWILKNLPSLKKISDSTGVKWDDALIAKIETICNEPVTFEVIYKAIVDENTERLETESVKQTLRQRIQARLGYALSDSAFENAATEITPLVNAIKHIKQLTR